MKENKIFLKMFKQIILKLYFNILYLQLDRLEEIRNDLLNGQGMNARKSMLYKAGYGSSRSLLNAARDPNTILINPNGLQPEGLSGISFQEEYAILINTYPQEVQDELINLHGLLLYSIELLYKQDIDLEEITRNLKLYAKNITIFLDVQVLLIIFQYQLYDEYHKKVKYYNDIVKQKDENLDELQNEINELKKKNEILENEVSSDVLNILLYSKVILELHIKDYFLNMQQVKLIKLNQIEKNNYI